MIEKMLNRTFKIRKSDWEQFIKSCNANGERHSTIIRQLVLDYIKKHK